MNEQEILVIDDEPQICRLLEITLRSEGYKVKAVNTAKEAVIALATHPADIVLLDIGLPDKSGHELLKEIRQWYEKPVIIISVQSGEDDIVEALDNGADDYLVKPFRTGELLARIRTALRKSVTAEKEAILEFGKLTIDLLGRTVKKDGNTIKLTQTEYNLLVLFIQNEGRALTHRYLLKSVWGPAYAEQTQYLRVFIAQLRKKIEDDINQPAYIKTESGIGYRFTG